MSPFTCVLRIEPREHIMRAPVAAQVCVSLLLLPKSLSLTVLARNVDASPRKVSIRPPTKRGEDLIEHRSGLNVNPCAAACGGDPWQICPQRLAARLAAGCSREGSRFPMRRGGTLSSLRSSYVEAHALSGASKPLLRCVILQPRRHKRPHVRRRAFAPEPQPHVRDPFNSRKSPRPFREEG